MTFTNRPPSFLEMEDDRVKQELDKAMSTIYEAHSRLDQIGVRSGVGVGFSAQSGAVTVTGSATQVTTGLTAVDHVVASIDNGVVPTNLWVTARVNPTRRGTVDLFVWQPTASGDNTPIASTVPVVVRWWSTGAS